MMKQTRRDVLLSVACVLLVFCAVRAVRRPAVSGAAQRIDVPEALAPAAEKATSARNQPALESIGPMKVEAAHDLSQMLLETARAAEEMKQQEAALELLQRQQETSRPLPGRR
jgi:hypothetical protein